MSTLPRFRSVNRREFLKISFSAGGALLVGMYLEGCEPTGTETATATAAASATHTPRPTRTPTPTPPPSFQPNAFIKIEKSGRITLTVHRSEMGQGVRTSLAMILAEELEANWADVHVEQMDVNGELNQVTSGSGSVLINFDPLRQAGAA